MKTHGLLVFRAHKRKLCARQKDLKKKIVKTHGLPAFRTYNRKLCARKKDFEKKIVKTHGLLLLGNVLLPSRASYRQITLDSFIEVLGTICLFFTLCLIDAL